MSLQSQRGYLRVFEIVYAEKSDLALTTVSWHLATSSRACAMFAMPSLFLDS